MYIGADLEKNCGGVRGVKYQEQHIFNLRKIRFFAILLIKIDILESSWGRGGVSLPFALIRKSRIRTYYSLGIAKTQTNNDVLKTQSMLNLCI